jgi:hypothetical protein
MLPSGYKLIEISSGSVLNTWGGQYGVLPDPPNPLLLPNGDAILAPRIGVNYSGYKLVLWEEQQPVPDFVTPRQVRLLLLQQGLLDQVEAMISGQDRAARITWEFAVEFRRDDPLLISLGTALGLTSQQIDEFFIAASAL